MIAVVLGTDWEDLKILSMTLATLGPVH